MPCNTMGFYLGFPIHKPLSDKELKNKNASNGNLLKIYFKTQVTVRESERSFKFADLFAAIGGFVGIFVGLSFMDTITAFKRSLQVIPPQIRKITNSGPPPPSAP